jgi:ribosomal protein S18 acetylase RimI-like enzyme
MSFAIRRLGPDDEAILSLLARDEADFDLDERSLPSVPLPLAAARAFLGDPNVLFWVSEGAAGVVGFLSCQLVRRRDQPPELLLYEIGVRQAQRRHGVGRALLDTMSSWMAAHAIVEVWVLADNPGAVEFYRACGFSDDESHAATYMTRFDEEA